MRLRVTSSRIDWDKEIKIAEKATTDSIRGASEALKKSWRNEIRRAGLGNRLANAIRSEVYPNGRDSMNAAALVWSNAPEIISAFNQGVVIRSRKGFAIAVPLPAAGRSPSGERLSPAAWERQRGIKLRYVSRGRRPPLLVAEDSRVSSKGLARRKGGRRRKDGILSGAQTVPIFVLVPNVSLKKLLDLQGATRRVHNSLPGRIIANWDD